MAEPNTQISIDLFAAVFFFIKNEFAHEIFE